MNEYGGVSKRDKRRKSIVTKVKYMNDTFEHDRELCFNEMLCNLQAKLYALHQGTDPEYLEGVTDLEEMRDYRLTELYLWERYQIDQARKQYEKETAAVVEAHDHMMKTVRQKLKNRLENQRKRLAEDRSLLNVSTDHSFFASAANPGIPTTRSAAVATLSGTERRTLRRRDATLGSDVSGQSGTEAGSTRRRGAVHASDDSGMSGTNAGTDRMDLDWLRFTDHPCGRGAAKSYNGVKTLKNEEGLSDLAEIAENIRHIRRKYGE